MRQLFIMRHAQAASPQGVEDKHRPLSKQGIADARALGVLMTEMGYKPQFALCSPARRTRQTLAKVMEGTGDIPAVYPPGLYFTTVGQLYEHIKKVPAQHQSVILVSHNPSVHALARFLVGLGHAELLMSLESEYRECTMTVLDCPIDSWTGLMPSQCDLKNLLIPGKDFQGNPDA